MTKFPLLIFLSLGQFAFGQSADSINKIVFNYGKSHSSWGEPGIYGRGEVIELSKTSNGNYIISRRFTTTASAGDDGKTFHKDTIELSTKASKIIAKEKIQFWLTQLNTNQENFTESFIKPKLTAPTKKEIYQVAKMNDQLDLLKDSDFDREDKAYAKKKIKEMKKFYGLDSFLITKRPSLEFELIVSDASNMLIVKTINNNDTTEYRSQFFESSGQPISRYVNRNYSGGSKVFNLEANTSAQRFLPKNSIISKVLDLNNIKEDYIKWYLGNKYNTD